MIVMIPNVRALAAHYRMKVKDTFVYRGMVVLWLIVWVLSFITMVYLWQSSQASGTIAGFTKTQLITYYYLGIFVWSVCGWYPFYWLGEIIRNGDLVQFITKPVNFYWFLFGGELAWHTISTLVFLVFFVLSYVFVKDYIGFHLNISQTIFFGLSLVVTAIINLEFNIALANAAFWIINYQGLGAIYWFLMTLLGGHLVPLAFFPAKMRLVANVLPFRFMFSFPAEIYLQQLSGLNLAFSFGIGIFWIVILHLIYRYFWQKGLKTYTGAGQ